MYFYKNVYLPGMCFQAEVDPNPLFLSHGSTVPLSALRMSETMVVAMVMPHCNILLQPASLPGDACSSFQAGKNDTEGRGRKRRQEESLE